MTDGGSGSGSCAPPANRLQQPKRELPNWLRSVNFAVVKPGWARPTDAALNGPPPASRNPQNWLVASPWPSHRLGWSACGSPATNCKQSPNPEIGLVSPTFAASPKPPGQMIDSARQPIVSQLLRSPIGLINAIHVACAHLDPKRSLSSACSSKPTRSISPVRDGIGSPKRERECVGRHGLAIDSLSCRPAPPSWRPP